MTRKDIAINKFKDGYNCAQSVIFSYADKTNISKDTALKISNGFGGGIGRMGEICGAISGAIMVLGLVYGRGENEEKNKQDDTYLKVRELIEKFKQKYGFIDCKKLIDGCNLLTEEGQERFKSEKMAEKCVDYISYIIDILDEIIK